MSMKVLEKGTEFASEVEIGSAVLWFPYKSILDIVNQAVNDSSAETFTELETCVKRCKTDFVNFLNYRGKSSSDREIIKKSISDGIYLKGQENKQYLHPQLINETLLLSDIFEINEFLAMDLLVTAESLKEDYPGWARGLIAVLLYYEGRLCMIQALSTIVTSIPGRTWHHQESLPRVHAMFQNLLDLVFKNDTMDKLVDLFNKNDVRTHIELLDSNLALGDWRHRIEVNRMINGIREGIAFIMFAVSAQRDIKWKETLRVLEYLKTNVKIEEERKLDKSTSLLIGCVLSSIYNHLNLTDYDRSFAKELLKYLRDTESKSPEEGGFQCPELFELFRLAFQIMTAKANSEMNLNSLHGGIGEPPDLLKDEDEYYFKKDVFAFLRDRLFATPSSYTFEENIVKLYHQLLTDFLTYMPMKVKDMRGRSEDAAKTAMLYQNQGFVRPPNLPQDYESFLECLGEFYSHEEELNLSNDYFDPDIQNLALNKLVRGACVDSPSLCVPNSKLLSGLAKGSPSDVFALLKQNGHNFSFDHFFESILQYLANFGTSAQSGFSGPNLYASEAYQRVVSDAHRLAMNPAEIQGICAYLDLVTVVCQSSSKNSSFFTNQKLPWIRTLLETAKIRGINRIIRAKMIATAASMISIKCSSEVVNNLWEMFYNVKLIGSDSADLRDELEEHESRYETYYLTISMLKLLDALVESRFKQLESDSSVDLDGVGNLDNGAFDPYVAYIRDSVLQKAAFRSYRNVDDRWEIPALSLEVLSKLLDYVPALMFQLLGGSPFLRATLATLAECTRAREIFSQLMEPVDRCALACLNLLRRALLRQSYFLHRRELATVRQETVIVGMQELLMKIVPETGRPEYIISVLKYIDNLQPATHKQAALEILWLVLCDRDDIDAHLYSAVITDTNLVAVLRFMFINILHDSSDFDEMRRTVLQIIKSSVVHSAPNFAMMLLGVDKKVDFQNAGVAGYPHTVLHAILDNAPNLPDAFSTLLILIRDPRLWNPLLRYLKTKHFFSSFLRDHFPSENMNVEDIGYMLKCIAVELKTTPTPGPLANAIMGNGDGDGSAKFQEILNMLQVDEEPLEIPLLEFFDQDNVVQAMKSCEYFDPKLKIRVIRVDMLENLLKEEIAKLEKTTVIKLRHTVHGEARSVVKFATEFNSRRWKEAAKMNMFDGWRQCLEVLVLSKETLKIAGVDFITSILRLILNKVVDTRSNKEYFCRLAAESVLTLCAVMGTDEFRDQVNITTLNVILNHMAKWISVEQSVRVRATLYCAVLHVVRMIKTGNEGGSTTVTSFSLILENLSKDCCQTKESGRMQAMYLMGEIIRLTVDRGLIGMESDFGMMPFDFQPSFKLPEFSRINLNMSTSYAGEPMSVFSNKSKTQGSDMSMDGGGDCSGLEYPTFDTTESPIRPLRNSATSTFYTPDLTPVRNRTIQNLQHHTSESVPTHLTIMTYMMTKGFLANLVEALLTVDDGDLLKLFSNQPLHLHMKSLYVFEAKIALLCRFAATGTKAIFYLMDTNVVHKLADMRVLQIQYYEEGEYPELLGVGDLYNISTSSMIPNLSAPTKKGVMEIMFTSILKLLHCMVDAAPKNVLLVEQIYHFLTIHDLPLSSMLQKKTIENEEPKNNSGCSLLTALLSKISKLLPGNAYVGYEQVKSRAVDVLRIQAASPSYSKFRLSILQNILLFLHNYSHNLETVRELKQRKDIGFRFRRVLNNQLSYNLNSGHPDEELTLGVIIKIVSDIADKISSGGLDKPYLENAITIMEVGLTIIHQHTEFFLNEYTYKDSGKAFCEEFIPMLDNRLVKNVSDAAKSISKREYTEMLLLRIRRIVHSPSK